MSNGKNKATETRRHREKLPWISLCLCASVAGFLSRAIQQAAADGQGSLLEASVHMEGQNAIWRLTNPGVWTWEYNVTTSNWTYNSGTNIVTLANAGNANSVININYCQPAQ